MKKEKERTYLIVLCLLITSFQFVDITIDELNILGNKATVPDGFVEIITVILWAYFLWCFIQNFGIQIFNYKRNELYINSLDAQGKKVFVKEAKKQNINLDEWHIGKVSDGSYHGNSISIPVFKSNAHGDRDEEEPLSVSVKDLRYAKFIASMKYLFLSPEFRENLFPYFLVLVTILAFAYSSIIQWSCQ